MKKITLQNSKEFAIVDDNDYEYLNRFNWSKGQHGHVYRKIKSESTKRSACIYMEQLILFKGKNHRFRFINNNPLDCRKSNIQIVTFTSFANMSPKTGLPKTSIFKGVCWDKKSKKWNATISRKTNGKRKKYDLGYFEKEKDAAVAYNKKAIELSGKDTYINIIN